MLKDLIVPALDCKGLLQPGCQGCALQANWASIGGQEFLLWLAQIVGLCQVLTRAHDTEMHDLQSDLKILW